MQIRPKKEPKGKKLEHIYKTSLFLKQDLRNAQVRTLIMACGSVWPGNYYAHSKETNGDLGRASGYGGFWHTFRFSGDSIWRDLVPLGDIESETPCMGLVFAVIITSFPRLSMYFGSWLWLRALQPQKSEEHLGFLRPRDFTKFQKRRHLRISSFVDLTQQSSHSAAFP